MDFQKMLSVVNRETTCCIPSDNLLSHLTLYLLVLSIELFLPSRYFQGKKRLLKVQVWWIQLFPLSYTYTTGDVIYKRYMYYPWVLYSVVLYNPFQFQIYSHSVYVLVHNKLSWVILSGALQPPFSSKLTLNLCHGPEQAIFISLEKDSHHCRY